MILYRVKCDQMDNSRLEGFAVNFDMLNNLIQPHAITLEHGEKAVKEILEFLKGEE